MISMGQILILGVFMRLSWIVSAQLKSRFRAIRSIGELWNERQGCGLKKCFGENGIDDVSVISVQGQADGSL